MFGQTNPACAALPGLQAALSANPSQASSIMTQIAALAPICGTPSGPIPTPSTAMTPVKTSSSHTGLFVVLGLLVIGGGAGFFFYKKRKKAAAAVAARRRKNRKR